MTKARVPKVKPKKAPKKWKDFPMWKQGELTPECGPYCVLALACRIRNLDVWEEEDFPVRSIVTKGRSKADTSRGTGTGTLRRLLRHARLAGRLCKEVEKLVDGGALGIVLVRWRLPTPKVGKTGRPSSWDPEKGHYVVVLEVLKHDVVVADPYPGLPPVYRVEKNVFKDAWGHFKCWGLRVTPKDA